MHAHIQPEHSWFLGTTEILWLACILSGSFEMIPHECLFECIALLWHKSSSVLQMQRFRVNKPVELGIGYKKRIRLIGANIESNSGRNRKAGYYLALCNV